LVDAVKPIPPRVEVVDVTSSTLTWLREEPTRLASLTPALFEDLVLDRIGAMGLEATKVNSTFRKDGGIDIIAWPRAGALPFLLAVQVKHSRLGRSVGPGPVRSLRGALVARPIDVGMIVTNTRFTPDAKWVAQQTPALIRLRDFDDLRLWILGQFQQERAWRELPRSIELAPGITISIPR
jgi:restriction endonuclease Mrr